MHPLLNLIATRPQLLADHAQAYADLLADEVPRAAMLFKRKALLSVLCALGLLLALMLGGVALLLWGALPGSSMNAPWLLWAVPLLPLLVALVAFMISRAGEQEAGRSELRQQLSADMALLRAAAASA
ncbi:MAG: hypothetical protein V4792_11930 [Pseudomonadota bacterium]